MYRYTCPTSISPDNSVWTGDDFSPCAISHYLKSFIPLILIVASSGILISTILYRFFARKRAGSGHRMSDLVKNGTKERDAEDEQEGDDHGHFSFKEIENRVIFDTVRTSIESSIAAGDPLDKRSLPIETARHVLGTVGSFCLLLVVIAQLVIDKITQDNRIEWEKLAFFAYLLLLSCIPYLPVRSSFPSRRASRHPLDLPTYHFVVLLYLYLPVQLLIQRSYTRRFLSTTPTPSRYNFFLQITDREFICESVITGVLVVLWVVYNSLPFRSGLHGILQGYKSGRGAELKTALGVNSSTGAAIPSVTDTENGGEKGVKSGDLNPADYQSIFGRLFFKHMNPIFLRHYRKPFTIDDVPLMREDDTPAAALASWRMARQLTPDSAHESARGAHPYDRLSSQASTGAVKPVGNIAFKLLWYFRAELGVQGLWGFGFVIFSFFPPISLKYLLKFLETRNADHDGGSRSDVAVLWVAMMVLGQIAGSVCFNQIVHIGRKISIQMRSIIVMELMMKALRRRDLSGNVSSTTTAAPDSVKGATTSSQPKKPNAEANIANLVATDAMFVSEMSGYVLYLFTCTISIAGSLVLLYRILGPSSLAGVVVIILMTPVQALVSKLFAKTQQSLLAATDVRLALSTETIKAIELIKYSAWEDIFYRRMQSARRIELSVLRKRFYVRCLASVVSQATPALVTTSSFAVYTLVYGQRLTASVAFSSLSLTSLLLTPLATLLEMMTALTNAWVSCQRIASFLNAPETSKYEQLSQAGPGEPQIGFVHASVTYQTLDDVTTSEEDASNGEDLQEEFRLKDISLEFPENELSLVVGPVASGKSTLILSLLGETTLIAGKINMPGDLGDNSLIPLDPQTGLKYGQVAYCPQQPFLIHASIRDNILWGTPYDEVRYKTVVHCCALERDLEIWSNGENTIVGEEGTVCSGGQKARIALARAVYSRASILLLDDVLSAVDSHTAKHLYQTCLKGDIMNNRTVILVTHAVGLVLPGAAFCAVLDNGQVAAAGSPDDLRKTGRFAEELLADNGDLTHHARAQEDGTLAVPTVEDGTLTVEDLDKDEEQEALAKQEAALKLAKEDKFFKAERMQQGSVDWRTYFAYLRFLGNPIYIAALVFAFIGSQAAQIEATNWLRQWSSFVDSRLVLTSQNQVTDSRSNDRTIYYLSVYVAINVGCIALIAIRTVLMFDGTLRASKRAYDGLIRAILGARMRFFNSTPSGRLLNRMSGDTGVLDQLLPEHLGRLWQCTLTALAILVVVTLSTPAFLIPGIIICVMYGVAGSIYNATSVPMKRVDSVTCSPVLTAFGEVLSGQTTIRAYADSARFVRNCLGRLQANVGAFYYMWQANRSMGLWADMIGCFVTIGAATFIITDKTMSAGLAGLSLSYAIQWSESSLWVVQLFAICEQNFSSVERINEYLQLEPEEKVNNKQPPAHWPSRQAVIEVDNLVVSYAPELEPVLHGISFKVSPGEKIGIVGRTGSGKSTLALCFFRFMEATSGSINIDGIDISTIPLTTLRRGLTIIPQESQLFKATVRENLDPYDMHTDEECWDVLRKCNLASKNTPAPSQKPSRAQSATTSAYRVKIDDETQVDEKLTIQSLDDEIAIGGSNLSSGEKQLLAVARALLKLQSGSSILVMDESTANLDNVTDAAIQKVLLEDLDGVTVLTIGHRLRTVINSDKILVLDSGRVVEFDSPMKLLEQEDSSFRHLCQRSGEEALLFQMAQEADERRRTKTW